VSNTRAQQLGMGWAWCGIFTGLLQLTQHFRDRAVLEVRQARVAVETECAIVNALQDRIVVGCFCAEHGTLAHSMGAPICDLAADARPRLLKPPHQDCNSLLQVVDVCIKACQAAAGVPGAVEPACPVDDTFFVPPRELAAADIVVAAHQRERADVARAILVRGCRRT
jgi:hypothetical protein